MASEKFSELLKILRTGKGISIRKLALALGKSPTYMWKVETKGETPSYELIEKIANFFGVDDKDSLYLAAGKVPKDIKMKIMESPQWIEIIRSEGS